MPTPDHYYDWEIRGFVAASSRLRMRDREDIFQYHSDFRALCAPLVRAHSLSHEDCDELFWLGLHPGNRKMISRRPDPWRIDERRQIYFEFQDVFKTAIDIFSQDPRDIQWERELDSCGENDSHLQYPSLTITFTLPTPAPVAPAVPARPASPIIAPMSPTPLAPAPPTPSIVVSPLSVSTPPAAVSASPTPVTTSTPAAVASPAPSVVVVSPGAATASTLHSSLVHCRALTHLLSARIRHSLHALNPGLSIANGPHRTRSLRPGSVSCRLHTLSLVRCLVRRCSGPSPSHALSPPSAVAPASPTAVSPLSVAHSVVAPALHVSLVTPPATVSAPAASASVTHDTSNEAPSSPHATSTTQEDQGLRPEPSNAAP